MTGNHFDIPSIIFAALVVACAIAARLCAMAGLTWPETLGTIALMLALASIVAVIVRIYQS